MKTKGNMRLKKKIAVAKFKLGDTVMLNSGGPTMTITNIDKDRLTCMWMYADGTGHQLIGDFIPECVTKVEGN